MEARSVDKCGNRDFQYELYEGYLSLVSDRLLNNQLARLVNGAQDHACTLNRQVGCKCRRV
jgi:hypothetical protein